MVTLSDLNRIKIFKELPEEQLTALIPHLSEKSFQPGNTILYRGDPGTSLFMLAEGTIAVTLINAEGIEYTIATMETGDIFGEMSLMTGEPRSANVKALTSARLFELHQKAFFELLASYPDLNEKLLQLFVQRKAANAMKQQSATAQRKGNIATLFAQVKPEVDQFTGITRWSGEINQVIKELSEKSANILITGERGTGKGLAARLIHFSGPLGSQPLLHLDCASPPPVQRVANKDDEQGDLLLEIAQESALFGHGANAGRFAMGVRRGYIELADNGAVILENVDSLTPRVQRRLVQYLKEGVFVRKGEQEQISSTVRILATTSRSIEEWKGNDSLVSELLPLIGAESLLLKPLRERKKDIPLLAELLLQKNNKKFGKNVSGYSKEALNLLVDHDWPLNVDELRQVVERAVAVATGDTIEENQVFLNIPTFSATGKYNLLRNSYIRRLADNRFFPTGLRFVTIPFILLLIVFTLLGPAGENPANLVVWAIWWPMLIASIIVSGRAWCGYCPLPIISDGLNFFRRKFLSVPSVLVKNGVWIGIAGFALILLAEHVSHMFTFAQATSILLITILGGVISTNVFFGKRAWCKHICPLGKMVSYTTPLSFIELDSNSTVCSSQCQTHDCVKDDNCPMGLHPSAVANSNDCILCLSCIKRCKHQAIRINARIPWQEIQEKKRWDAAGAFFAIMLAALVLAVKLPSWGPVSDLLVDQDVSSQVLLDVMSSVVIGGTFITVVLLASGFPKNSSWKEHFSIIGYAYLSLACAGFFNIYFHEFVYHGHNLGPWFVNYVGWDNIVTAAWITPELGTLKILIPLLTLTGAFFSWLLLSRLSTKHALPVFVKRSHVGILLVTTLLFLIIL